MPAVEASDVFHLYATAHGDVAALRGLNLTVADGEVVSVLGPTGAGKSTLLDLCAGFRRPSGGSLNVLGVPVATATAARVERLRRDSIGIVGQHYHRALPLSSPSARSWSCRSSSPAGATPKRGVEPRISCDAPGSPVGRVRGRGSSRVESSSGSRCARRS